MRQTSADQTPANENPFKAISTIGLIIWELLGRSVWRMILAFVCVFLASFAPAAIIIFASTAASQSTTRGVLLVLAALCIVPLGAIVGFNYVAYRGLSKIVEELGLGRLIGSELAAYLVPGDRMRIPLAEFNDRIKAYFKGTRQKINAENRRLKGLIISAGSSAVLFTIRLAINRIAKGCLVDGELDLPLFAQRIAERADRLVIGYFKKILWDLTRILLILAQLILCCVLWLVTLAIGWVT